MAFAWWSMMVTKQVCVILIWNCLWVLLLSRLTCATESNINCLRNIKSQLKDPNGHLSNWVFGSNLDGYICTFNGVECWHDDENRVLSINLSGLGLLGEFPSGVKECSDLTGLKLAGNKLSGTLSSDIPSFILSLTILDLSNNSFSGEIPASLSDLAYINTLLLDHNQFTGQIPPRLALNTRLARFSVSHNHLKGPIPEFTNENISPSSFEDNPDLCGFPLDPCSDSFSSIAIIPAACAAVAFFPAGAAIGWFRVGKKQKQRPRRR